jgi:hypothetical protein
MRCPAALRVRRAARWLALLVEAHVATEAQSRSSSATPAIVANDWVLREVVSTRVHAMRARPARRRERAEVAFDRFRAPPAAARTRSVHIIHGPAHARGRVDGRRRVDGIWRRRDPRTAAAQRRRART